MAAVSNSIVHLTMRFEKQKLAIGTGFIYKKDERHYIITAWHNLTGRHPDTLNFQSTQNAVPNNIVVSLTTSHDYGASRIAITLPLIDDEKSLYLIHPTAWPRVDVVAIPFNPREPLGFDWMQPDGEVLDGNILLINPPGSGPQTRLCSIQDYLVPSKEVISEWLQTVEVTEELFIPGYPHDLRDQDSQPVWKRATIASSIARGWNDQPKFLIDTASKSGMSGSPVLYYSPNGSVTVLGKTYKFNTDVAILAGIYVGREGVTDKNDPQVGIVWHASVIDEIIEGDCFERLPYEIEVGDQEIRSAIAEELKNHSKDDMQLVLNPATSYRTIVRDKVLKRLHGRARPKEVAELVIEQAKLNL